jgi:HD superfamily phosphohydrolase
MMAIHENAKIFNDPIHGHIELSNMCVKIIDTPQFQRLRDISQLGGVYYVFAGASSRRFEHCIGVSFLARQFALQLRARQPELNVTDEDVLCLEIAGLCHDLGHGPFSHMYDGKFLPQMGVQKFVHEHASIALLDLLLDENDLWPELRKNNLNEADVHFIKELILGDEGEAPAGFKWVGRPGKAFLYDIVANKRNGIDVDKFDYFARDCHVLGVSKSFDCHRLMRFARVFSGSQNKLKSTKFSRMQEGSADDAPPRDDAAAATGDSNGAGNDNGDNGDDTEICFHVKEAWNLFELFHTRYTLHKRAYQHRVSNVVELMVTEVFKLSDPFITIPGKDRKPTRMSECPKDMHAYWRLGEYIMKSIEHSFDPNLAPAQALIERIRRRDLFSFVGETLLPANEYNASVSKHMHAEIMTMLGRFQKQLGAEAEAAPTVTENDVFCSVVRMGYGKGGKNPVTGKLSVN